MEWRKYCDFNWNHSTFPNPVEWIESIHKRGLKICLWEHPYISVESDLFQFGTQKNYFVKHPDGSVYVIDYGLSLSPRPDGVVRTVSPDNSWNARVAIIDLTNPNAYNWFKDLHRPLLKMGIDVFKTDFGEDIPADAVFHNEQTGATMHNMYPLLYNKAVFEVTQEEKGYGLVWSRSATAGNQRYPTCWSGDPAADFDSLACTIRGGLSIGMSGIPFWSNDIGSYRGTPSPQLYIRWAQFGLFCSHSRMHGDSPREPWHFGKKALAIVRRYVELRYRFFPYIYSTSIEASKTGMPVLRALPLAFPNDPNTFNKDLEFLFGENFLVAPIYNESNWRTIYFPKGRWISFWDGTIVEGEQNLLVNAPLEILPLYVRAGAIIPTMELVEHIPEGLINPLIVDVFPSENGTYTFYEDDAETKFICEQTQKMIHFEWRKLNPRKMIVRLLGVRKPKNCKGGAMKFAKGVCNVSLDAVKDGKIIFGY
jgi:alpha-D-xyloside xylohydrolase